MRKNILFIALVFSFVTTNAQDFAERKNKGRVYVAYGVNRTAYDLSTLRMSGDNYNFNLTHFDANDDYTGVDFAKFNAKLGYYFTENLSIGVGYGNFSYKQLDNRLVKIGGTIDTGEFAATYFSNQDVVRTTSDFMTYEYINFNYLSLNLGINDDFWASKKGTFAWSYYFTVGGGLVMSESEVSLFGGAPVTTDNGMNGYGLNAGMGTRLHLGPLFLEIGMKGGYMEIKDVALDGTDGKADHSFLFASGIASAGLSFRIGK